MTAVIESPPDVDRDVPTTTRSRTIVVGYNRRPACRRALAAAADRAGPWGRLIVVHATDIDPTQMLDTSSYTWAVSARADVHEEVEREIAQAALGTLDVEVVVDSRPVVEALSSAARAHHADQIVVGRRRRGLLRSVLSSVSRRVVRTSDRPVLVVPLPDEQRERAEGG